MSVGGAPHVASGMHGTKNEWPGAPIGHGWFEATSSDRLGAMNEEPALNGFSGSDVDSDTTTIDVELVALMDFSTTDTVTSLPTSITQVGSGDTYYVEVWAQQQAGSEGIQGGSVDIRFMPHAEATYQNLNQIFLSQVSKLVLR